jgi:hypothetical protein
MTVYSIKRAGRANRCELIVSRGYSAGFGVLFRRSMGSMAKRFENLEQLFIVTGPFWASKERHLSIPGLPYIGTPISCAAARNNS